MVVVVRKGETRDIRDLITRGDETCSDKKHC